MAQYGSGGADYGRQTDEYGNPIRQTDEFGNPVHRSGGTHQTGTTGAYPTELHGATGTTGAYPSDQFGTTAAGHGTHGGGILSGTGAGGGHHRRSGSSSSSVCISFFDLFIGI